MTLVIILSRAQDTNVIFVGAQVLFFLYENDYVGKLMLNTTDIWLIFNGESNYSQGKLYTYFLIANPEK